MIVLGVNSYGHDAAAVLLVDGEVAFASSEERFDRVRHSAAFPAQAISAALAHTGLAPRDVDAVAFPWTRGMGRLHKLWHVARHWPRSRAYFRDAPDAHVSTRRGYLHAMRHVADDLRDLGVVAPLFRIPHHAAHAVSATLALPDGNGAVLTADGMGEWTTAAAWHARAHDVHRIARAVYPDSPGKAYAAVTQWLGFFPESQEGKTMGLAAYGQSAGAHFDFGASLCSPRKKTLVRVRRSAFDFPWGHARLYGEAFHEALGPARARNEPLRANDADVARGIQHAMEVVFESAARDVLARTRATHLGLAGGLFLNCALNGTLQRVLHRPVCPFPVAGDAGAAWGAAASVFQRRTSRAPAPLGSLRLGSALSASSARTIAQREGGVQHVDVNRLGDAVAHRIEAGLLVAVARGRSEFGPRALGGRSLISRAHTREDRDRVNARKGRESWRPLAPVVRVEDRRWFANLQPSPHMILTFRATDAARAHAAAVLHEDGTARVQTVATDGDSFFRAILDTQVAQGWPDVFLNTSLNVPGEPIVNTADEAWAAAVAMDADVVVLDDWLIDRRPALR